MRALVVYESIYGNTHVIASNIEDGLRATHEVTLVPVTAATAELVSHADLLVVGGPTHMHGLSSASSRRMAAQAASKEGSGLTLDPDASGPGLREWLKGMEDGQALAAAFDTRLRRRPPGHRPRQPRHQQAAEAARLPHLRRPGELPDRPSRTRYWTARPPGPAAGVPRSVP